MRRKSGCRRRPEDPEIPRSLKMRHLDEETKGSVWSIVYAWVVGMSNSKADQVGDDVRQSERHDARQDDQQVRPTRGDAMGDFPTLLRMVVRGGRKELARLFEAGPCDPGCPRFTSTD